MFIPIMLRTAVDQFNAYWGSFSKKVNKPKSLAKCI